MTGGMAFVYDKEGTLPLRINLEDIFYQQQMTNYWEKVLYLKIEEHIKETNSLYAKNLLENWENEKLLFWQIVPKEMINKFDKPVLIQGLKDNVVTPDVAEKIVKKVKGNQIQIKLLKNSDHRLSDPFDLKIMNDSIQSIIKN